MSWLSDAFRGVTGGYGVGETTGAAIGSLFGPGGGAVGARIGGAVTEFIDVSDRTEGQATARDISPNLPRETGMSGNQPYAPVYGGMPQGAPAQQAFVGGLVGPAAQAAGRALSRNLPNVYGVGVGAAATAAFDYVIDMFGNPKKLVITRKMKREVMELYHYLNMDLNAVAQAYSQYKGMSFTPQQIQKIMLKKFRNDGAYVTKAAIRKTRSTVRKLERLEALKKQITGTRAAPRRRAAATTRITQVK